MKSFAYLFFCLSLLFAGYGSVLAQNVDNRIPRSLESPLPLIKDTLTFEPNAELGLSLNLPKVGSERDVLSFMPVAKPDESNVIAMPNAVRNKRDFYFMDMNPMYKPREKKK